MRPVLLLAVLALAGCATAPPREAVGRWDMQASATAGAALVHAGADGRERLRIACRRNPADLWVATGELRGSGAPVALTVGGETFTLTPADAEAGLSASAPLPPALPAALMGGGTVALSQGGRSAGPFPPPDARTAAAFAIACRGPVR